MKPIVSMPAALTCFLATAAASESYNLQRTLQLTTSANEAWHLAGDFCDIDDWHPGISGCKLKVVDGRLHRFLTTTTGEEIVEQRIAAEQGLSYTYAIESTPFPLEDFIATFSVESLNGALFSWSVSFSSDDPSMEGQMTEFVETGLAAIEASFGTE